MVGSVSRVSSDRAAKLQRQWCDAVSAIYRDAAAMHLTHAEVLSRFTERVTDMPEWRRVPRYVQTYVLGYRDACMQAMWRSVVWMKSVDGKLLSTEEVDALSASETGDGPSPWQRCDTEASCFVWRGADGQPIRDRRWA